MKAPGIGGSAKQVCNCRCALLQRARWALDEDELDRLKVRAEYYGLDKTKDFEEFKKKYLQVAKDADTMSLQTNTSGARITDTEGAEAKAHAERYYGLIRSMTTDVDRIARNTGYSVAEIQRIKNYVFYEKHDLGGLEPEYFAPDFAMAQSWQRLMEGKPEPHDLTMLQHEITEQRLMESGMSQHDAHIAASKEYDYSQEVKEFYAAIKKRGDEK